MLNRILDLLNNLKNDENFLKHSFDILKIVYNNNDIIFELLDKIIQSEQLINKCECYDFLDKLIVYYNPDTEISARISLFNNKYANRIHFHRWDYSAIILKGKYTQYIYGVENDNIKSLYPYTPLMVEEINKGHCYYLNNKIVHSIKSTPNTISMCIRNKSVKDRFMSIDPITNNSWYQYGAKLEAYEEKNMKSVDLSYIKNRINYIKFLLEVNDV